MNTQQFIYALEVAKTGSITQAAGNLYMSQPTLSKAIKELEASLGFPIFKRTSKGVVPTLKGQEFLAHARRIAAQIQIMEAALQTRNASHQLFSLAIPRVSYIAQAASEFVCAFDNSQDMEIDILEANSMKVIEAVADGHFVLGVIRCHREDEDYFLRYLEEKGLQQETVWESDYEVLMRKDHPLSRKDYLTAEAFAPYIEIAFGDEEVPYIRVGAAAADSTKRILVYDRAMQFDLLRSNPLTYMWASPLPHGILESNRLMQRKCGQAAQFRDLLISRVGYRFSKLDRTFIDTLYLTRNKVAYDD